MAHKLTKNYLIYKQKIYMKRLVLLANILIGGFALNAQTLNDGLKSLDFDTQ